jgi:hypothetical protein
MNLENLGEIVEFEESKTSQIRRGNSPLSQHVVRSDFEGQG